MADGSTQTQALSCLQVSTYKVQCHTKLFIRNILHTAVMTTDMLMLNLKHVVLAPDNQLI